MIRRLVVLAAFLLFATSMFAQLPPGKWWRKPELVSSLGLSEEQQSRLDSIFRQAANDLIDARADVEKQTIALRGELDQPQLNRTAVQHAATRLNEARGHLFSRELAMLVDMRGVLSEPQWNRLRARLDQFENNKLQRQENRRPRRQ